MLDIYTYGDEVLREECSDITEFDDSVRMLADAMIDTLDEADGVGLAGPQVGVPKKLFVVHIRGEEPIVFINPSITETSIETGVYEEGCLSIPGVYHDVIRPVKVGGEGRGAAAERAGGGEVVGVDHLDERERDKVIRSYEKKNRMRKRQKARV